MAPARRDEYDEDDYDRPRRREYDDEDDYDRPSRRDYASRSFRKDEYEDEDDDRPSRPRRGFRCPYCGSDSRPFVRTQISPAGWIVFVVMLVTCLPLFFIGLLITEEVRTCSDCGARLN